MASLRLMFNRRVAKFITKNHSQLLCRVSQLTASVIQVKNYNWGGFELGGTPN